MKLSFLILVAFLFQFSNANAVISCGGFSYASKLSAEGGMHIYRCVKGNHENVDDKTSKCDSINQDGDFYFTLSAEQIDEFNRDIEVYADDEFDGWNVVGYAGAGAVAGGALGFMLAEPTIFLGGVIIGAITGTIYGYYNEKEDYDLFLTTFSGLNSEVVIGTNRTCVEVETIISSAWSEATGGPRHWFGSIDK